MNTHPDSKVVSRLKPRLAGLLLAFAALMPAARADHTPLVFTVPYGYNGTFTTHINSTLIGYVSGRLYNPNWGEVASVWSMLSPSGIQIPSPLPILNLNSHADGYHEDIYWTVENLPAGNYFLTLGGGEPYVTPSYSCYALVDFMSSFWYSGSNLNNPFNWSQTLVWSLYSTSWATTYSGDPSSLAEMRSYSLDLAPAYANDGSQFESVPDLSQQPTFGFTPGLRYGFTMPPTHTTRTRGEMVEILKDTLKWPGIESDANAMAALDKGSIGLAWLLMNRRYIASNGAKAIWRSARAGLPEASSGLDHIEHLGFLKGYLTLAEAQAAGNCPEGTRLAIFCKVGRWKDGNAPDRFSSGQIPLDSVTNFDPGVPNAKYWVMLGGKWHSVNFSVGAVPGHDPTWEVIEVGDPDPDPSHGIIFFVRCMERNQW